MARYSSSFTKLWVKVKEQNASQVIQMPTSGCVNVDDLTKLIKKELFYSFDSNQITLHQSLTDPALEPDFPISSLSAAGLSAKVPLIVKSKETRNKCLIVITSNIAEADKLSIVVDLLQVQSMNKFKNMEIQRMEREIQFKNMEIQSMEREIQSQEKSIQRMEKWYNERVGKLLKEVDLETLYRLHYQQVLTVTRLIVLFEENFRVSILKIFRASVLKDLSRLEKWSAYLQYKNENFKPFQEAGFTVDQVSNLVDSIFKPHLMDIHSIKLVEGLLFRTRGTFTADQMKVLKIIVEESSWKDVVSIE